MEINTNFERNADLKTFDESQMGVKGLIDAGVTQLPRIFVNDLPSPDSKKVNEGLKLNIPVIDFTGLEDAGPERRKEIIKELSDVTEKWGFFQVVNHGIPQHVLEEMLKGARRFHDLDAEAKRQYYVRGIDTKKKFVFTSNFYLYTGHVTNWRDTTVATMNPMPDPEEISEACRDIMMEYGKSVRKLGLTFMELLSEAMGLNPNHLEDMDSAEDYLLLTHYYPPCPQPESAIGINKHADNDILTVLLQDDIGGLQVLHDDIWYDVPHIPGALVINTGDLLQLISNDKYKSVIHRVQSKKIGPRISVACFFRPSLKNPRLLAPIKELLSDENPPIYRETTAGEYLAHYYKTGQDYGVQPALENFKLNK
ncbi:1-aminocyclopropane-1-carboxylate oxidase homolog 1-like [Chenopodium quinoa]|uniref:1-aminocyclopropane-1-carboxylate oxidase homolog 1-like n=1 Tax=Chenopodium quinoa TaxID=63459 RepID=UPI000B7784E4|nr:1-aminocyclopropane-1-carboxylate oxidase homolog 1-like [Chenopodium quinoa]